MARNSMRRTRRQPITPAPGPIVRTAPEMPTSGYALVVDGQIKSEFKSKDMARARAEDLKRRFPYLQVRLFDAEKKHTEDIEPTEA
ncbi:hypothetical protein [Bradyrhizobium sp. STM 3562]|uniref:hypothetical protein n=1 Tax=Bradyrhizobium sp. STM 3562 TaxID=578924 RepID=UPI00388EB776